MMGEEMTTIISMYTTDSSDDVSSSKSLGAYWWISVLSLAVFSGLLLSFIFVCIKRKMDDFFLKKGIRFMIAAMILRVAVSVIVLICFYLQ